MKPVEFTSKNGVFNISDFINQCDAAAMGEQLPPELPCRVVDVISLDDKREIITAYRTITRDSRRDVEVAAKKQEATQAAEQLRGSITTAAAQD